MVNGNLKIADGQKDWLENLLKRIKTILTARLRVQKIFLFGSFAEGKATEDSDLDLLVVVETDKSFLDRQADVRHILGDLHASIPISPIVMSPSEIEARLDIGDHFIEDILKNGISL